MAAIGSLNRDVYSAGGFVRQYLDALARKDTATALALPGVMPTSAELEAARLSGELPRTLLRPSMLRSLEDIRLTDDTEISTGVHVVSSSFLIGGSRLSMKFTLERAGTVAGVFDSWRFRESPLAVLQVTVLHGAEFVVNKLALDTRAHIAPDATGFSNQAAYLAFAPSLYTLEVDTPLLSAAKSTVPVTTGGLTQLTVDAQPNEAFAKKVQAELDNFLDQCTQQQVLLPSDCPFGIDIEDRVEGLPIWSITEYPPVSLVAGEASYDMPVTPGMAHIVVEVQSLFDGEMSTRDEDVPFSVSLSVSIEPDNSLNIRLH
ncbi:MAG: hypothetical protein JWQ68_1067 [Cryobacterium sp.]|nr:hypothetical protein [Cryobacterium sp.]